MIVAVVPALNEAARIGRVVRTMPALIERSIVVDDGSDDDTSAAARVDPRVEIVRHAERRGVGAAIAHGMARAIELDADVAVVLAGDGQMDPLDLPALVRPVERGDADLVKGNRLAWPSGALAFPLTRLIGVVALGAATRLATGVQLEDAQCGYVAVGRRALRAIPWRDLWPSFGYPNDLLARAAASGLRIAEVPVRPIYAGEQSKLRARHVPGIAFVLARAIVRRATR